MPFVRTALLATAACLISAAAYAQPSSDSQPMPQASPDSTPSTAPPASSDMNAPATADTGTAPATTDTSAAPVGAAANTSATVNTDVIASQPVPDTPANRAAYGKPLSRAGKITKPAGN